VSLLVTAPELRTEPLSCCLASFLAMQRPERVVGLVSPQRSHSIRFRKGMRIPPSAAQMVHAHLSASLAARAVAPPGRGLPDTAAGRCAVTDKAGRPLRAYDIDRYIYTADPSRRRSCRHQLLRPPSARTVWRIHILALLDIPTLIIRRGQDRYLGRTTATC
jgi:hypothetical protein